MIYLVLSFTQGVDYWRIYAVEKDEGTLASMQVTQQTGGQVVPMGTAGGDMSMGILPGGGSPVRGTLTYALFLDRLDYMLGRSNQWTTCEDLKQEYIDTGRASGHAAPLCEAMTVNDVHPDQVAQAARVAARHSRTPESKYLGKRN